MAGPLLSAVGERIEEGVKGVRWEPERRRRTVERQVATGMPVQLEQERIAQTALIADNRAVEGLAKERIVEELVHIVQEPLVDTPAAVEEGVEGVDTELEAGKEQVQAEAAADIEAVDIGAVEVEEVAEEADRELAEKLVDTVAAVGRPVGSYSLSAVDKIEAGTVE